MGLLNIIRRMALREKLPIREIARRTGMSHTTIKKYLNAGTIEPLFATPERQSKLDPFADKLAGWLKTEAANAGYNIVLNGIEPAEKIEPARKALEDAQGIKAIYSPANMMKPGGVRGLIAEAEAAFGQVDVLVNNAGIQFVSPIEDFPDEKWEAILSLNLSAAFYATKAVVAGMKARKLGRIINIASAHGLVASPFKSAYVAAKHDIVGLTKTVALEAAEHGVTVNAICPGYVWTPLVGKQIPETARARGLSKVEVIRDVLLAAQPTKKFATVEELAAVAVFLCSDGAASITGTALPVDGGWTAH